jgi:hypothetical protein
MISEFFQFVSLWHYLTPYIVIPLTLDPFLRLFLVILQNSPTKGGPESHNILTSFMLPFSTRYYILLSEFQEAIFFLASCLPSCQHQHSFQKGDNILNLITFSMRSLEWHRENHHFFLIPLSPITLDFNKLSC